MIGNKSDRKEKSGTVEGLRKNEAIAIFQAIANHEKSFIVVGGGFDMFSFSTIALDRKKAEKEKIDVVPLLVNRALKTCLSKDNKQEGITIPLACQIMKGLGLKGEPLGANRTDRLTDRLNEITIE